MRELGGRDAIMTAALLASHGGATVYHASHLDLLAALPRRADGTVCDLFCTDFPYSEKTHTAHAHGAATANRALEWASRRERKHAAEQVYAALGRGERRKINYPHWTPEDVEQCVTAWSPVVRGWFLTITDEELAPHWRRCLEGQGRTVFGTLPYVAPGSRVRMNGDGPSSWTCWIVVGEAAESVGDRIVVARPSNREFASWGTLRGAYVLPAGEGACGQGNRMPVVGGKPPWLMRELVRDYSRRGDLVVDGGCGAGTTLRAAQLLGRGAVGCDLLEEHARLAADLISQPFQPETTFDDAPASQGSLWSK